MYFNTYLPITSLPKAPHRTGGLCAIKYFRWEDVLKWPEINPQTNMMSNSIQLKPGSFLYYCTAIDQTRSYEEKQNAGPGGPSFDITVKGALAGSNAANVLNLQSMIHHKWGLIVEDRSGVTRLIGNEDSGADFLHNYGSGDLNTSRKTEVTWKWEHTLSAPVYTAQSFDIVIGGITITAGSIQLILRFRVGDPTAPMAEGDTILIRPEFPNKYFLVLADGTALPIDDMTGAVDWTGSIQRHVEKAFSSNTMTFVGSVANSEIIEIYAFN